MSACATKSSIACLGTSARPPTLTLVYPIDLATAVPDSPASIVFEQTDPTAVLNSARLVLMPPSGPAVISGPAGPAPSPLPTPNASPAAGATLVGFTVPALAAATTYLVSFQGTVTQTGLCAGTFPIGGTGSFTTQ
jgi:hypothetical protein